jgi:predicted RNase H-like HicB family nuclease
MDTTMRTIALIEQGEDGIFGIFTPELKSTIIGTGETVAEAKADFENSVRETLQMFADMGRTVPEELRDLEFDYKWDIASVFNYFDWINVSKLAAAIGVTPSLMRYYKKKGAYLSDAQTHKIEIGLHLLADELKAISL